MIGSGTEALRERFQAGDRRALARAISLVERRDPAVGELLAEFAAAPPPGPTVGFTGAPGAGKSTLVDAMVRRARERDRTVGVLAVDPSSPFSGGALLGDRVRMHSHALDEGVFVRSMGARGHTGGLSAAAAEAIYLLGAFGLDEVMVETVGAGQSEFEVTKAVDTTVLVLTPGMGDSIQLQKAGIMEVADVYVVNKADLPDAATMLRDLRRVAGRASEGWTPAVVATVANQPDDSQLELWEAIDRHRAHLRESPAGAERLARRLEDAAAAIVGDAMRAWALAQLAEKGDLRAELLETRLPAATARRLLEAKIGQTQL
jgi:LAO/AO transport system kinase